MSTFRKHRPRFRRDAADLPPLRVTARDLEILRRVAAHRFLRSSHIAALMQGSHQHVLRRLQVLFHYGYLDRPTSQIDYYHRGGTKTMAYCLAKRGAGHLRRVLDMPFSRMVWSGGKGDAERQFLEHALMVSEIMVRIEIACRKDPAVRFLPREAIPLPASAEKSREPFHWFVDVSTRYRAGVIPDAVFGLEFPWMPEGRNRAWFFVEADRGTMPLVRQNLNQSSYFRKLLSYEATWAQRIHKTRLGLHRFRVLTVTSSAERSSSIAELCRQLERGRGLFLFTDLAALAASPDALGHEWMAASGMEALRPSEGKGKPSSALTGQNAVR